MSPTRREFVATSAAMLASSSLLHRNILLPMRSDATPVLFQGDSITDCGRDRTVATANDARALGTGYPLLLAGSSANGIPSRTSGSSIAA